MPPDVPREFRARIERFPAALRRLLDRELDAGNSIATVGGGFPAPPIGEQVMLAQGLQSGPDAREGLVVRTRASSLNHLEITDGTGHFFILTPPIPPPPLPSMDEIRTQHDAPRPRTVPQAPGQTADESLQVDIRGETLIYRRSGRTAYLIWTYTQGHRVYRSSLTEWVGPGRGESVPMEVAERDAVLERILELARLQQGIHPVRVED